MEESARIGSYMRSLLDIYESVRGKSPQQVRTMILSTSYRASGEVSFYTTSVAVGRLEFEGVSQRQLLPADSFKP